MIKNKPNLERDCFIKTIENETIATCGNKNIGKYKDRDIAVIQTIAYQRKSQNFRPIWSIDKDNKIKKIEIMDISENRRNL
jgi:phage tail tube protein FII